MANFGRKRPTVQGERVAGLRLSSDERFVLSRADGTKTVDDLAALTGMDRARLDAMLAKLAFDGALRLEDPAPSALDFGQDDDGTTSMADWARALGLDPGAFEGAAAPAASHPRAAASTSAPPVASAARDATADAAPARDRAEAQAEEGHQPSATAESEGESPDDRAASAGEGESEPDSADEGPGRDVAERNYRAVYASHWRPLTPDQRIAAARTAGGADLLALAFDPDPRVIGAVLENATTGLEHARLIALHHRSGVGLELLARRRDWLRDLLVERRLLRNPMLGEVVFARVMATKQLLQTYKVAVDRDIPELTRIKCRGTLKQKWQSAPSEERADLLLRTEARCLVLMSGCTFDARTTSILCGRPIHSAVFVQGVAKFAAAPPGLLAHLFKQPFVRKNPSLRKMLLSHPNMPGEVKRSV